MISLRVYFVNRWHIVLHVPKTKILDMEFNLRIPEDTLNNAPIVLARYDGSINSKLLKIFRCGHFCDNGQDINLCCQCVGVDFDGSCYICKVPKERISLCSFI